MLVNVKTHMDHTHDQILSLLGQGGDAFNISTGVYLSPSFSFGNQIVGAKNEHPHFDDNYEFSPYGVCDNAGQVIERYKEWLHDPNRRFCISLTRVVKSEQPEHYGWRWHKWGEYIGTKTPQMEYLYDEDDSIQEVYCYHIYEILN